MIRRLSSNPKRVVIVGGGIAGLGVAEALTRRGGVEVSVLERSTRAGGHIQSQSIDGFVCEAGPNGFVDSAPQTVELARRLGLTDRLLGSQDAASRQFIYRRRRFHEVPNTPWRFLRSGLFSWPGKLRILTEPLARARPGTDETIHAFACRRLGREAAEVVDAMVPGISAGDPRQLSLRACLPKMWELETRHRGLLRAAWAASRDCRRTRHPNGQPPGRSGGAGPIGLPGGRPTSFKEGMQELIDALTQLLGGRLTTSAPVIAIRERSDTHSAEPGGSRYLVDLDRRAAVEADAVVLATPAHVSSRLTMSLHTDLARALDAIPSAALAVVCLGYDEQALTVARRRLKGFGFLVPRSEGIRILGALWESNVYAGRAPAGRALVRAMLGGARDPNALTIDDRELVAIVREDLRKMLGISAAPVLTRTSRHPSGIPQYTVGHLARMARIDACLARHPGLFLAGSSYRGVSMNACIGDAQTVAGAVAAFLQS